MDVAMAPPGEHRRCGASSTYPILVPNMGCSGNCFKSKAGKFLTKAAFSHVGLCVLVVLYAVIGALLFKHVESLSDDQKDAIIEDAKLDYERRTHLVEYIATLLEAKADDYETFVRDSVEGFYRILQTPQHQQFYISGVEQNLTDSEIVDKENWSFPSALLFTTTILTTIGYGHVAPKTSVGQILVIFYALFAIPLMSIWLYNLTDLVTRGFYVIFSKMCSKKNAVKKAKWDDKDVENTLVGRFGVLAVAIAIFMAVFFVLIGSFINTALEGWTFTEATYFGGISILVIGLGDYVPGSTENIRMLWTCFFILVGMVVIAVAAKIVLQAFVHFARKQKNQDEEEEEEDIYEDDYDDA